MMRVDLQPTLEGDHVILRPLRADDWSALFAIASDPLIWEQHPAKERSTEAGFRAYFEKAIDEVNHSGGAFAVIDKATGRIIGCTRYHGFDPQQSQIEIGWTFLARSHWGGIYNHEMKRLMLDYIFQFVATVVFLVDPNNIRSQIAMKRLGAINTGVIQQRNSKGQMADHLRYIIRRRNHRLQT